MIYLLRHLNGKSIFTKKKDLPAKWHTQATQYLIQQDPGIPSKRSRTAQRYRQQLSMVSSCPNFKPFPIPRLFEALSITSIFTSDNLGCSWIGTLKPTPLSKTYTVSIHISFGGYPTVFIHYPALKNRHEQTIPHLYLDKSLCLFRHTYGEWDPLQDLVSEKLIPWISEWITFYEYWHVTGQWLGGGEHPEPSQQQINQKKLAKLKYRISRYKR